MKIKINSTIYLTLFFVFFLTTIFIERSFSQTNIEFFFGNSEKYKNVVVNKVLSVNSLILKNGEKIKLIGLKSHFAPRKEKIERDQFGFEVKKPAEPMIPVEEQAFDYVKNLLEGKHVRLEFDTEKNSPSHKTLAYVFFTDNDLFVNAEILRQGYAHLQIRPPNLKYSEQLRAAYRQAKKEKRGFQNE